jgi:zinc transport system substrate-binding protein
MSIRFMLCILALLCASPAWAASKPVIAVSIVPQATFARAVCGDLVDIVTMIPPGASPSNYEPAPELIAQFSKAALYFSIGVPTEKNNILPALAADTRLVPLAEAVSSVYPDARIGQGRDPHIWLSPKRAVVLVQAMADAMAEFDPANKARYHSNAAAFIAQIQAADAHIQAALAPVKNKKFMVFHPAFGYIAADYGLTMYALEDHGKEATAKHLQEMLRVAKQEQIKVIFYQAEIDSRQSQAFAEEIGGVTMRLEPLSADYIANLESMAATIAKAMR